MLFPITNSLVIYTATVGITPIRLNFLDFVHQLSNVDSSADRGTHSNFTAQRYGPDSVYDSLTEENTGAITCRNASSRISQGSISITKPTGTIQNDVMIANIYCGGSGNITVTPPSGWTLVSQTSVTGQIMATYFKVAGASEPSSYSWSVSGGQQNQGGITTYYGVDTSNPINAYSNQSNSASTSYTAPSVTTTVNNTMLVGAFGAKAGGTSNTVTPPSGFTELYDIGQNNNGPACLESSDYVQASAGASGNKVATGQSGVNIGHLIALKPASGTNYQLDLEEQWTGVDFHETNEELCIYVNNTSIENLRVDVWNGSSWQNVIASLNNGWNNATVSAYLVSSTFTIRFNGSLETTDATQDSWAIDATLLHLWS
jgi:hypothetical protein